MRTTITCLDPNPRTDIEAIADVRIPTPLEECDLSLFDELEEPDILFMDGSHRAFVNSDATVFFLEVLPALKPGVLVQIHDIKLPYDYPTEWVERLYNEQFLLGSYLLAETRIFEVLLPNALISNDAELRGALDSIYEHGCMDDIPPVGASFWIRKL